MTTLRDAALAALSLVQDTLLERAIDTKRLSAIGRDLEAALAAEPDAQPVAWYVERRAPGYGDDGVKSGPWWSKNEAKRFADDHHVLRPLYAAPQPPADEVAEPAQPVAWRSWTGQCGYGYWESQTDADLHSDPDYRPVPLYTAPPAPADVPRLKASEIHELLIDERGVERFGVELARAVEAEVRRRCGVVE